MNLNFKIPVAVVALAVLGSGCTAHEKQNEGMPAVTAVAEKKPVIQFIVGSTRQGRTADKIAKVLNDSVKNRPDITTEIVDLRDYSLPFLHDEIAPISRKVITDPSVAAWSNKISMADAYIIVVPEYNAGYPGVLKNALDSLYKEWGNKPVAFVGYSGGPSGGTSAVAQLRAVTTALGMKPAFADITIAHAWKAFNERGELVDTTSAPILHTIIDQMVNLMHKKI